MSKFTPFQTKVFSRHIEDLKEKGLLEPYILPQIALHEIFKPKPPSINANKKKKTAIKKLMFHFSSLFGKSKQSVKA